MASKTRLWSAHVSYPVDWATSVGFSNLMYFSNRISYDGSSGCVDSGALL